MDTAFQDKVAVVTGAGGTLCSVIAKHLASLGCKVVLVGRTREKLEKVAEAIAQSRQSRGAGASCPTAQSRSAGPSRPAHSIPLTTDALFRVAKNLGVPCNGVVEYCP